MTAISLIIPLVFGGFLRIYIPPFSATLASHVPLFLAITISPFVGSMVGFGSALGFLLILGPIIGARASVHILLGWIGGLLYRKNQSLSKTLWLILPLHALGEALVVLPFGFDAYTALIVVGLGTALHHILDGLLAYIIFSQLIRFFGNPKRLNEDLT